MVDLSNQRRMAASILKCGINRVKIDPNRIEDVAYAVTRDDIRKKINDGFIEVRQKHGISRGRTRFVQAQKAKGKRKGQGSRKGPKYARFPRKRRWISTIRPIRAQLREFRDQKLIERNVYRKFYMYAKGGMFKSRAHLISHLKAENVLKSPEQVKSES